MFTNLPQCAISGRVASPSNAGLLAQARPTFVELTVNTDALFVKQASGDPIHVGNIDLRLAIDPISLLAGIALPPSSICIPDGLVWTFTFPDGSTLFGTVTDDMVAQSPLNFLQLRNTYLWDFVSETSMAASSSDPASDALASSIAGALVIINGPNGASPLYCGTSPVLLR